MKFVNGKGMAIILFILLCIGIIPVISCFAQEAEVKAANGPERKFTMNFVYPEVILAGGSDAVDLDLTFKNKGKKDEVIYFEYESPSGWQARVKTYSFDISSIYVPAGEERSVTFNIEPDKETNPGVYFFKVNARSEDGALTASRTLKATLTQKEKERQGEILLKTSYPVLQGPSDGKFEFSVSVNNETKKEQPFNLIAEPPKDWQVNFKPPFKDTFISSLVMKPDENQNVNVIVTPDRFASAGEYVIPITVSAGDLEAKVALQVNITGTYKIDAGTATGLLSLETQKGKAGNLSIYVKNTGSATLKDVSFLSVKPENWDVQFSPEKVVSLEPGSLKQVEVTIVPAEEALVGDYAVGINVNAERTSDDLELRVTVRSSAAWGWIGIGIIVIVIVGLFGLFLALGRR
ncbi:MAG: NEW3 domain-containing protein [Syntrophales bacterium]|jgi:uncharacterized membrane protein|nr:NEW3 domain-containing protein [Syntrophales bacterium]MDY0044036.1 NEW3 domain-containing protein [Syntrophales bacterium]